MTDPPELRPLRVGELLDRTFALYRRTFLPAVGLSILGLWPWILATAWEDSQGPPNGLLEFAWVSFRQFFIGQVATILAQAAVLPLAWDAVRGVSTGPGRAIRAARSRLAAVATVALITGLVIPIALVAVVPGLILLVGWSIALPVVMTEDLGGPGALAKSWRLTRGHAGRILLLHLILFATMFALESLLALPWAAASVLREGRLPDWPLPSSVQLPITAVAAVLTTPLQTCGQLLLCLDLRVRGEGLDVRQRLDALAEVPPVGPVE